jgi:AraC family transcriptional regulator
MLIGEDFFELKSEIKAVNAAVELRRYRHVPPGTNFSVEKLNAVGMTFSPYPRRLQGRYAGDIVKHSYHDIGTAVFRPRHTEWEVITTGGPLTSITCMFDDSLIENALDRSYICESEGLKDCFDLKSPAIVDTLRTLHNELVHPGFASTAVLESGATLLIVYLARLLENSEYKTKEEGLTPAQKRMIDEFLQEIHGQSPSVEELARHIGISVRSLQRKANKTYGLPVASYIADSQLSRAKELLEERNLPLKEIAFRLGFSSHSHFTLAFRRAMGVTPSVFRAKLP